MQIIETEVDKILYVVYEKGKVSSREVAEQLSIDRKYVMKIAYLLQKRGLIDLKTSYFELMLMVKEKGEEKEE